MSDLVVQSYEWGAVAYSDASHRYWIIDGDKKISVPSVTGVLSILDKPELYRWYEQMGVEGVKEAFALNLINPGDRDLNWTHVVRENCLGAEAKRDAGAIRGTAVHEALRAYHAEGKVPSLSDYEGPEEAFVAGLQAWLVAAEPDPVMIERIVGSRTYQYAGRFDLLAQFDERLLIIDLKTRKRAQAYPADMLQLDGYWSAAEECDIRDINGAAILAIAADGSYTVTPMPLAARGEFAGVLQTKRAFEAVRKALRGSERL